MVFTPSQDTSFTSSVVLQFNVHHYRYWWSSFSCCFMDQLELIRVVVVEQVIDYNLPFCNSAIPVTVGGGVQMPQDLFSFWKSIKSYNIKVVEGRHLDNPGTWRIWRWFGSGVR